MPSPLCFFRRGPAAAPLLRMAMLGMLALGGAALGGCPHDPPPEYSAQIRRTSFGIPHVLAENEAGLGYGLGNAFAQDNLCLLADLVTTVRGERSKYFGAQQTYDPNGGGPQLNLASDVFFKYVNDDARVEQAWQTQTPEVQALLRGYAAGVNRYLRDTPQSERPVACRDQPWVHPLTERDLVRVARRLTLEASGGAFMGAIFAAQPPGSPASSPIAPARYRRTPLGSNAIALGRAATASGTGLLLANPHFPWNGALRFYQAHLTIPGKVDVMGAALSGLPLINLGFNRQVAWTHTVNSAAHFTLYSLQLDPADPTRYSVGGQWKPMIRKELIVETAEMPGQVVHSLYLTEHGPIVHLPELLEWKGDTAFALRDANLDNDRALEQWWALDRAESLDVFDAEIKRVLGLPWVNAVATDRAGTVSYANVTPVPNVSAEMLAKCIPPGLEPMAAQGLVVLSGSDPACAWRESSDAPQPGIFAARELPMLRRDDFVQNSNDSAWMTNPATPLTGFSPIISQEGFELGARTRLGLQWLTAPGGAPQRFTEEALQAFALSNRSFAATELLAGLREACAGAPDLAAACRVLARWDGTAELASIGWPLFSQWKALLDDSGMTYWRVPFDPADPLRTPRGLAIELPEVKAAVLAALEEAASALAAEGLDYSRPWGELQVATRGDRKIAVHGGGGDDFYNVIESERTGLGWREVSYGSSALFTVSFASGEPVAHGLLTYSQSADPASLHFADQTERFSAKQWSALPFSERQILADPNLTTSRISE